MLCTEAEAAGKWCPNTRTSDDEKCHQSINRPDGDISCLASKCMTWRWDDPKKETGYCGLAGRPYVYETEPTSDRT